MALTRDDILKFRAPLPLDDHEVKIKVAPKKDDKGGMKKSMWLAYIDKTGIIPLIQDVDPNYSWIVVDKQRTTERLCIVTGRLIIGGNSYDGVGGATPNYDNDPYSEDTEKAAETDAFKRAAINVGVGLYLRNAPQIWVNGDLGSSYQAKDEAWKQFEAWYRKTYGSGKQPQQQRQTPQQASQPTQQPTVYNAPPPTGDDGNVFACASAYYQKTSQGGYVVFRADHDSNLTATMFGGREKLAQLMGKQWADANDVSNWANGNHELVLPVYVKWAQDGDRKLVEELRAS